NGRFQSVSLHLILLPQALLGAITSTAVCLKPLGTVRRQDGPAATCVTEWTGLTGPQYPPTGAAGHLAGRATNHEVPKSAVDRHGRPRRAYPNGAARRAVTPGQPVKNCQNLLQGTSRQPVCPAHGGDLAAFLSCARRRSCQGHYPV